MKISASPRAAFTRSITDRIGRLYRSGSVIADSKSFFTNVDAVGNDLRLIAIPTCGKGQPMQVKRMSNGGPTLRSRARLAGN